MIAYLKNRGISPVITTLIIATSTIVAAALTSLGVANVGLADVNGRVDVVQTREEDHYSEIQKQLQDIKGTLNVLVTKK